MRNITISLVALLGILPAAGAAGPKINAATNIDWTKVAAAGAPTATCNSSFYGEPYTNTTNGDFYVCASSGWVLVTGGGGGIGGSGTVGFLPKFVTNSTTLGNSLIDYGVTTANVFTSAAPIVVNDGTGAGGALSLQQGTAAANGTTSVTLTVPASVTSYRITLPGVAPTSSNTYLSCTAADPSVCTWSAGGGGTTVNVNGGSVSNPNFNLTTPAAGSNGKNVTWQVSSSSVSAEIVGDGNATHCLSGTGTYVACSGGSGTPGGSTTQVQYNNAGSFGGIGGSVYDGTTLVHGWSYSSITPTDTTSFFTSNVNSLDVQADFQSQQAGYGSVNGVVGAVKTTTPGVHQSNGVAGFVNNSSGTYGVPSEFIQAVGGYFQAICSNGSNCWGGNALVASVAASGGNQLVGFEIDSNINNTTDTELAALLISGFWGATPSTLPPSIRVAAPGGGHSHWGTGLVVDTGSVTNAMEVGPTSASASSASPPIILDNTDSGSTLRQSTIKADASGNLLLTPFAGLVVSTLSSSTLPICANGTGNALTTSGCIYPIPSSYRTLSCTEVWVGSGTSSVLQTGDDAFSNNTCYNDSGVTRTITAVKCRSDHASNTTTVHPTFGSAGTGTTILTGAVTCGSSLAYSSSGTVTNASWTTGTGINPVMGGTLTGTSIAVIIEYTIP